MLKLFHLFRLGNGPLLLWNLVPLPTDVALVILLATTIAESFYLSKFYVLTEYLGFTVIVPFWIAVILGAPPLL